MKGQQFQIIADVYRVLGAYDAKALAAASKQHGLSANLRSALSALALEAGGRSRDGNSRARPKQRASGATAKARLDLKPGLPPETYREDLVAFLRSMKRFPDKPALVRFAASVGLSITPDAKLSRQRVAGQIARRISEDAALRQSLDSILSKAGDDQTEGWLNLILKGK